MNSQNRIFRSFHYFFGLFPLAIIAVFYYLCIRHSINIPWFDDIENIPYFLIRWIEAQTVGEKWQEIIHPNNEHRVLTARLIVLGQYLITNKLNFKDLLFCGNLSVLAIFGILAYSYLRQGGKWYLTVPVAFFIFNFQSYAGTFMTIMSMQYQMVILLSIASFYFLAKQRTFAFFLAIFLAYVDTFSMGNGMMVWPSGLVLLLFQVRWRDAFLWSTAAVISIYFYFHGYDFVQGNDKAFTYILEYPVRTFIAFFTMLGGDFDMIANAEFNKRMVFPTLAGLVLFSIFILWCLVILAESSFWGKWVPAQIGKTFKNYQNAQTDNRRWNAFWLGTLIYVLVGMILVVVFRTRFDPNIILWSTYKMYPAVLTSVIYIIVIQSFKEKFRFSVFLVFLIISAGVWASTLINYLPIIEQTSRVRTAFAFNQKRNGVGLGATKNSAFETMLATTLLKVEKMGIYSLPQPLIHPDEDKISLKDSTGMTFVKVDLKEMPGDNLSVRPVSVSNEKDSKYAVLESKNNLYLFAMSPDDSEAMCPKGTIREGEYKIGVWIVSKSGTKLLTTDQKIFIQ